MRLQPERSERGSTAALTGSARRRRLAWSQTWSCALPLNRHSKQATSLCSGWTVSTDSQLPAEQPLPRGKPALEARNPAYVIFMLFLSLFALAALAVEETVSLSPGTRTILRHADTLICVLFFLDFVYLVWRADNRKIYFLTWGWLDLASSIPVLPSFRWGRAARVMRILRVLRCIRSARILIHSILNRRSESTLLAACLATIVVITVSAVSVLHFEAGAINATITTPEDAVWWSIFTTATLGYGEKFPVTTEGKAVAAVLVVLGLGLLSTLAGFVASWFSSGDDAATETKLRDVQRELEAIKELIKQKNQQ